jgi:hypothetical protein
MAKTFKYGAGIWATKTGSSLAYNDQNDNYKPLPFSVTRNSIATRVNKQGLIEVVGKDKLRIDYTDSDKGVALLEPSRTNLETKSNEFSTWTTNSNITRTANYIVSPDGTLNGTRLQFTANGFCANTIQVNTTQYTISCYAKRNDSGAQNVGFFINGSGAVNSAWEITNEWKRFTYTYTSGNTSFVGIAGLSGADISVYGFQLEQGSYATSYIPTSGSTVQRQSDVANGAGNAQVFNDSEGVLMFEGSAKNDAVSKRISISDGSFSNRISLDYTQVANTFNLYISDEFISVVFNVETNNKLAFKYKNNDCSLFLNGFKVAVISSVTVPVGLDTLQFTDANETSSPFYGKTKRIGYYDAVLTDAELEYLTSYRSLNELVTELNLNTL